MSADKDGEKAPETTIMVREGSDLCRWTLLGDISGDEMRRLLALQKDLMEGCEYYVQLMDVRRIGDVASEARKAGSDVVDLRLIGTAIFGASFHVRVISKLIATASAILHKANPDHSPVKFFETEKEALAWLNARVAEHLKRRG